MGQKFTIMVSEDGGDWHTFFKGDEYAIGTRLQFAKRYSDGSWEMATGMTIGDGSSLSEVLARISK